MYKLSITQLINKKIKVEDIIKEIKNYKYISFDIFDTLIKRNISKPNDVFKIVKNIVQERYGIDLKNFENLRVIAEKKCYRHSNKEEISINDIYNMLPYEQCLRKILIDIEEKIEIDISTLNYNIIDIYEYCIKAKKKVYIISDMYLREDVIKKILIKNNIKDYTKLYVSSTFKLRKFTGNLYKEIQTKENINKNEWLHIGDNKISDFFRAKQFGIRAILIPNKVIDAKYFFRYKNIRYKDITYNIISNFINNNVGKFKDIDKKIGYEVYGPLLYGFSEWLLENLNKKNIKSVYFLSRDGYIMQKAFNYLGNKKIRSKYLYVSRKSLFLPTLYALGNINKFWNKYSYTFPIEFPLETFFKRFDLDIEAYSNIIKECGYKKDTLLKRKEIFNDDKFNRLYFYLKEEINKKSYLSYKAFLKYIDENISDENIAIVDVGWRGSLQSFINDILRRSKRNINIEGFYIGIRDDVEKKNMNGYLNESFYLNKEISYMIFSFVIIIEWIFTAPQGTVRKYIYNDNYIDIIFEEYEYKNRIEDKIIKNMQEGALTFFKDILNNEIFKIINIKDSEIMFSSLFVLGTNPNKEELIKFSNLISSDTIERKIALPKSIFKYLLLKENLKNDFIESRWRIGFLKNLLKIDFPYYKFLQKIYILLNNRK